MKTMLFEGQIVPAADKEIYDWFGIKAISETEIRNFLTEANGEDVEIQINSPGGDCETASVIRAALKSYAGNTIATITGLAASAATIVMTGCKQVRAHPTAMMMLHCVSIYGASGNARDMEKYAEVLKTYDRAVAAAYVEKTGFSEKDILDVMAKETWLSAKDALDYGLIDSICGEETITNGFGLKALSEDERQQFKEFKDSLKLKAERKEKLLSDLEDYGTK